MIDRLKAKKPVKPENPKEPTTKEVEIVDSLALVISCSNYYQCIYEPISMKGRDSPIVNIEEAHQEANDAVSFYRHFGDQVIHVKDPKNADLAKAVSDCKDILYENDDYNRKTIFFCYFLGHGAEKDGSLHAVLNESNNESALYDLEKQLHDLGLLENIFVHAMFDCSRTIPKVKVVAKKPANKVNTDSKIIFAFACSSGDNYRSVGSNYYYMKQVKNRFENKRLVFPFCLAFLKGNGSMDLANNLTKVTLSVPVYDEQNRPQPKPLEPPK